jgi:hypothetical protein
MKKITLITFLLFTLFIGCKKNDIQSVEVPDGVESILQRSCAANDVFQQQLANDPSLRIRMDQIDNFTKKFIANGGLSRLVDGVIEIPVVVNVLYRTTLENISDAQIQSQIDVLNEDFNNTNSEINTVPDLFTSSVGKVGVRFVLIATNRKATNKKSWGTNDAMKKSKLGGIDPTDPVHNLNMWACNLGQGLLGYAQFPGGDPATDGVVILYSAFGSKAKYSSGTYISKYDLGRTATHEVGHWINLRHIWGDDGGGCSGTDQVADTPNQGGYNFGCPEFPHISCSNNGDMSMNYMDYTDDACMYMFSQGQVNRMLPMFASGGPRAAIGQ